jgi:tetratricopeptide (TPR) repeat protein
MLKPIPAIFFWLLLIGQGISASTETDKVFQRGVQLQQSGDLAGARDAYQTVLVHTPRRVEALANLGQVFDQLGEFGQAVLYYRKALQVAPNQTSIRLNLGLLLFKKQHYEEARKELSIVTAERSEDYRARHVFALCLLKLNQLDAGIAQLEMVHRAQPANLMATYTLGSAYLSSNQIPKAEELIKTTLSHVDTAESHLVQGAFRFAKEEFFDAVDELEKAIQRNPQLPSAHSQLGALYFMLNDWTRSMKNCEAELKINPNDFTATALLAWIFRSTSRLEEADRLIDKALRLKPDDFGVLFQKADMAKKKGDIDASVRLLEQVISRRPDYFPARVLLAQLYFRLNRKEKAEEQMVLIKQLEGKQKRMGMDQVKRPDEGR